VALETPRRLGREVGKSTTIYLIVKIINIVKEEGERKKRRGPVAHAAFG
jgi:hypothetical protein